MIGTVLRTKADMTHTAIATPITAVAAITTEEAKVVAAGTWRGDGDGDGQAEGAVAEVDEVTSRMGVGGGKTSTMKVTVSPEAVGLLDREAVGVGDEAKVEAVKLTRDQGEAGHLMTSRRAGAIAGAQQMELGVVECGGMRTRTMTMWWVSDPREPPLRL